MQLKNDTQSTLFDNMFSASFSSPIPTLLCKRSIPSYFKEQPKKYFFSNSLAVYTKKPCNIANLEFSCKDEEKHFLQVVEEQELGDTVITDVSEEEMEETEQNEHKSVESSNYEFCW